MRGELPSRARCRSGDFHCGSSCCVGARASTPSRGCFVLRGPRSLPLPTLPSTPRRATRRCVRRAMVKSGKEGPHPVSSTHRSRSTLSRRPSTARCPRATRARAGGSAHDCLRATSKRRSRRGPWHVRRCRLRRDDFVFSRGVSIATPCATFCVCRKRLRLRHLPPTAGASASSSIRRGVPCGRCTSRALSTAGRRRPRR